MVFATTQTQKTELDNPPLPYTHTDPMMVSCKKLTEVWHMAHFWVSYGRCTMPGSPMGRSEGSSRRWTG